MKPLAILGAAIGGIAGAMAIGALMGGPGGTRAVWIFVLLGALIGGGCYLLGGRGGKAELVCFFITTESVVAGYLFAGWVSLHTDMVPMQEARVRAIVERQYSDEIHIEVLRTIADFKALEGKPVDDEFLLSWRLRDPAALETITDDERDHFATHWHPKLQKWVNAPPSPKESKEAWIKSRVHFAWHNRKYTESFTSIAWESLSLFDLVFVGVALIAGPAIIGFLSDRERSRKEREAHFARKGLIEFTGKPKSEFDADLGKYNKHS